MTLSNTGPFGPFRYTVPSDSWWWSEQVYAIHGFQPGEVVPTTELILAHAHPSDAQALARALHTAATEGGSFSVWHRIVDSHRAVRQALTIGEGLIDPAGEPTEVRGYVVDLTEPKRRSLHGAVDDAVRESARSRADIEQAKGVLMLAYSLGADDAFALLRRFSQNTNVKVRELAGRIVDGVVECGRLPAEVQAEFDRLLTCPAPSTDDLLTQQAMDRDPEPAGS